MKKKTAIAVIARRENYIRFMTEKLSLFLGDAADFHGYIKPDIDIGSGRGSLRVTEAVYQNWSSNHL